MKILMLCDLYIEDAEYQENLMTKYYKKLNHEVIVVASLFDSAVDFNLMKYPFHALERDYIVDNVKIYRRKYSINFLNRIRKLSNVFEILNQEKPDLIYAHGVHINLLDAKKYMQKDLNCKLVMDYHGDYSNSAKNWLSIFILHKVIRKKFVFDPVKSYISKIFPVTPSSAAFLCDVYNVPEQHMELLPLGADIDLKNEIFNNDRNDIRKCLGISSDDFVIFTGGKMNPQKKTDLLLDSVEKLRIDKLHVIMVGNISEDFKLILQDKINKKNIHFVGWQASENIYKYLHACDLAVFPQSQSILWQQSICAGLPLVVGIVAGSSIDYLNKYDNIIILKNENISIDGICGSIKMIYENKILFQLMTEGAKKVADEELNWNKLILRTLV